MAAARAPGHEGKVVGLPPATVDGFAGRLADHVLVEADGSRGRRSRSSPRTSPRCRPRRRRSSRSPDSMRSASRVRRHVHRASCLEQGLGTRRRRVRGGWPASPALPRLRPRHHPLNKADDAETRPWGDVARRLRRRRSCAMDWRPDAVSSLPQRTSGERPEATVRAGARRRGRRRRPRRGVRPAHGLPEASAPPARPAHGALERGGGSWLAGEQGGGRRGTPGRRRCGGARGPAGRDRRQPGLRRWDEHLAAGRYPGRRPVRGRGLPARRPALRHARHSWTG